MAKYTVQKHYKLSGLDLLSNKRDRDPASAIVCKNLVQERGSLAWSVRKGSVACLSEADTVGMIAAVGRKDGPIYNWGKATKQLVPFSLVFSNTTANPVSYSTEVISNNWHFLARNPSTLLNKDISKGFEITGMGVPIYSTVNDLITAINTVPGLGCSLATQYAVYQSYSSALATLMADMLSTPASKLAYTLKEPLVIATSAINSVSMVVDSDMVYADNTGAEQGVTGSGAYYWPYAPSVSFDNGEICFAGFGDLGPSSPQAARLYICDPTVLDKDPGDVNYMMYPNPRIRPLGIGVPDIDSVGFVGGSGVPAGSYTWLVTFSIGGPAYPSSLISGEVQGIEGDYDTYSSTLAGPSTVNITVNTQYLFTRVAASWGALAVGNQTGVTLAADDGGGSAPLLAPGESVYVGSAIYDVMNVVGSNVVLNKSTTVVNNQAISPKIFLNVYRTKTGPSSLFYHVGSMPISAGNSMAAVFTDTLADSALGVEFVPPEDGHESIDSAYNALQLSQSLVVRDMCIYGGVLTVLGDDVVVFSGGDGVDFFPSRNNFTFNESDPSVNTACLPVGDGMLLWKHSSTSYLSGNLGDNTYSVKEVSNVVGCANHACKVKYGEVVYFADTNGVYQFDGTIKRLSDPIEDAFYSNKDDCLLSNRMTLTLLEKDALIVLYLPRGESDDPRVPWLSQSTISSSSQYAFNLITKTWSRYYGPDMGGGIAEIGGSDSQGRSAFFAPREALTEAVNNLILRRLNYGSSLDIGDNTEPTPWEYKTGFDTLGETSTDKQAVMARVTSEDVNEEQPNFTFSYSHNIPNHEGVSFAVKSITSQNRTASIKMKAQKATGHGFGISGSSLNERPVITGVEVEYATPFKPSVKDKGD